MLVLVSSRSVGVCVGVKPPCLCWCQASVFVLESSLRVCVGVKPPCLCWCQGSAISSVPVRLYVHTCTLERCGVAVHTSALVLQTLFVAVFVLVSPPSSLPPLIRLFASLTLLTLALTPRLLSAGAGGKGDSWCLSISVAIVWVALPVSPLLCLPLLSLALLSLALLSSSSSSSRAVLICSPLSHTYGDD